MAVITIPPNARGAGLVASMVRCCCALCNAVLSGGRARRTRTHMLEAWTLSRAASLTLRCSVLCHIQQMHAAMIQHSASGDATESGEVSDPGCSRPAAAMLDARARMFTAQTLSRAASLTLRCSLLCHIQLSSGSSTRDAGSEEVGDPLQRTVLQGTCTYHCTW